jgi:hypothetical protein
VSRDLVLARLAAARGFATRIAGQIDEAIDLFLIPEEDPKGLERVDLFDEIIDDAGRLSRVMEKVQEVFEACDPMEPSPEETDDDEGRADPAPEITPRKSRARGR